MNCYESVFIIRQDTSSSEIDRIVGDFIDLIQKQGGKLVKNEYWGLLNFAYEIKKNYKGHYVMLAFEDFGGIIEKLKSKIKLMSSVVRFLPIKVDSISAEPSVILKNNVDNNAAINVTEKPISKE